MNTALPVPTTRRRVSVARDRQSYKNIGYLLCSFFLGLFYLVLLVPGICLGIATLIIWLGVPMLFAVMWLWWQFAAVERSLAISWLGVTIAPMDIAPPMSGGWWHRFQERLSNSMTWKTLAYLLLKFPLGICSLSMTLTLLVLGIGITAVSLVLAFLTAPFYALVVSLRDVPDPKRRLQGYLLLALAGFGSNLLILHLLNSLAFVAAQLARGLLGMSDTSLRLEEAKARAEQERMRAEQAEQRRRELVVNVSHELRAPVASVSGHLESLLLSTENGTKAPTPAMLYSYLSIAYQEARRLGMLVDDLLSLARMESHELRLDMREVVASEVVEEVYQTLTPLAQRERQVTLVRGVQPNLPPVLADRQRLVQVLTNLARNAITSTPAGGIVSLSLESADQQHLALIVEDNGVGIPADELPMIFDRLYRTDASRSRATGGFGLGLAIVHDLVTAMGGSIRVESAVGQGCRFSLLLRCSSSI
jgi:two-component system, OmpR family, phosphate regulon sensor histidine kinase PhoR